MSVIWSEEEAEIIEECIKRYDNIIFLQQLDPKAKETILKALNKEHNTGRMFTDQDKHKILTRILKKLE